MADELKILHAAFEPDEVDDLTDAVTQPVDDQAATAIQPPRDVDQQADTGAVHEGQFRGIQGHGAAMLNRGTHSPFDVFTAARSRSPCSTMAPVTGSVLIQNVLATNATSEAREVQQMLGRRLSLNPPIEASSLVGLVAGTRFGREMIASVAALARTGAPMVFGTLRTGRSVDVGRAGRSLAQRRSFGRDADLRRAEVGLEDARGQS